MISFYSKSPIFTRTLILPLVDMCLVFLGLLIIWSPDYLRSEFQFIEHHPLIIVFVITCLWGIILQLTNSYRPVKLGIYEYHMQSVGKTVVTYLVIGFLGLLLIPNYWVTARFIHISSLVSLVSVLSGRLIIARLIRSSATQRSVLVVGAGVAGQTISKEMLKRPSYGYRPVGFSDDNPTIIESSVEGLPVLGGNGDLLEIIRREKVQLVVLAITHNISPEMLQALYQARKYGVRVIRMHEMYELLTQRVPIRHLPQNWANEFLDVLYNRHPMVINLWRFFDYLIAVVLIVVCLPIMILVALLILVFDGCPVLFIQERVGKGQALFKLYKFRTMRTALVGENEGSMDNSWMDRITRIGKILRAVRLDELPQLFNIVQGNLRLVGPRPFILSEVESLSRIIPYYSLRFLAIPGITGHAQVSAGYENNPEEAVRKLECDLFYIKYQSIWFDLIVILRTLVTMIGRKGS